jgi:hypothetical protein
VTLARAGHAGSPSAASGGGGSARPASRSLWRRVCRAIPRTRAAWLWLPRVCSTTRGSRTRSTRRWASAYKSRVSAPSRSRAYASRAARPAGGVSGRPGSPRVSDRRAGSRTGPVARSSAWPGRPPDRTGRAGASPGGLRPAAWPGRGRPHARFSSLASTERATCSPRSWSSARRVCRAMPSSPGGPVLVSAGVLQARDRNRWSVRRCTSAYKSRQSGLSRSSTNVPNKSNPPPGAGIKPAWTRDPCSRRAGTSFTT